LSHRPASSSPAWHNPLPGGWQGMTPLFLIDSHLSAHLLLFRMCLLSLYCMLVVLLCLYNSSSICWIRMLAACIWRLATSWSMWDVGIWMLDACLINRLKYLICWLSRSNSTLVDVIYARWLEEYMMMLCLVF
jgi:hypothetical protein